jgi:hypothetical protein
MPDESDGFYGGDTAAAASPSPGGEGRGEGGSSSPNKSDQDHESESETALLPKSLFPGEPPAIGEVCQFRVEHIWEDEIEVSHVKEGEDQEKSGAQPGRSQMDTATDSFDQMAGPAA